MQERTYTRKQIEAKLATLARTMERNNDKYGFFSWDARPLKQEAGKYAWMLERLNSRDKITVSALDFAHIKFY